MYRSLRYNYVLKRMLQLHCSVNIYLKMYRSDWNNYDLRNCQLRYNVSIWRQLCRWHQYNYDLKQMDLSGHSVNIYQLPYKLVLTYYDLMHYL